MKEIIEILSGEFYGLFCGFFGCAIDSILMITLFGKKKYSYILPTILGIRFIIYNVGLLLIANHFYGGQQWFKIMMPTIASASTFFAMFLSTFLWQEQLAKVLLAFCLCDFGGTAIVYEVPSWGFAPIINAALSVIIFFIIYKIITPLLKKYRNYRIRHSYICSELLILLILSGWLSNFLYVSIEDSMAAPDTMLHKMGIYFTAMVLIVVAVGFLIYSVQLSQRKRQLIYATEQMESYYSKVDTQIKELQEFRQDVEAGFEKIIKTEQDGTAKEKKQSMLAYIEHLQERYQLINNIFFCPDYIIDGLLCNFKASRDKQQQKTDILFQNYDRGKIKQEDIVQILLNLMNNTKEAEEVSLHVAAVKNQLILSVTVITKNAKAVSITMNSETSETEMPETTATSSVAATMNSDEILSETKPKKILVEKQKAKHIRKGINKYLKKYDGTLYVTETPIEQLDSVQGQNTIQKIIIGLRRN